MSTIKSHSRTPSPAFRCRKAAPRRIASPSEDEFIGLLLAIPPEDRAAVIVELCQIHDRHRQA